METFGKVFKNNIEQTHETLQLKLSTNIRVLSLKSIGRSLELIYDLTLISAGSKQRYKLRRKNIDLTFQVVSYFAIYIYGI